ncbi:MAG: hypothetical protein R3D81_17275 [Thalassovita sp.]
MDGPMNTQDLTQLTATQARGLIRSGDITALDLTRACLGRIAARDDAVRAWITLNPQAEAQAAVPPRWTPRPLAGISRWGEGYDRHGGYADHA